GTSLITTNETAGVSISATMTAEAHAQPLLYSFVTSRAASVSRRTERRRELGVVLVDPGAVRGAQVVAVARQVAGDRVRRLVGQAIAVVRLLGTRIHWLVGRWGILEHAQLRT